MADLKMLPHWVIQLVADVEYYESVHGKGEGCIKQALDNIPDEARQYALGWREALVRVCIQEGHKDSPWSPSGADATEQWFRCVRCGEESTQPFEEIGAPNAV